MTAAQGACGPRQGMEFLGAYPSIPLSVRVAQPVSVRCRGAVVYPTEMTADEPLLWRAILARLDPPPESTSIDSVTAALGGAVGRGTVQRIRDGVPGTSLDSLNKIAKRLGCTASDLLEKAAPPKKATPVPGIPPLRQALTAIRNQLAHGSADQSERAGEALKLMAKVPDSERAFEEALRILVDISAK